MSKNKDVLRYANDLGGFAGVIVRIWLRFLSTDAFLPLMELGSQRLHVFGKQLGKVLAFAQVVFEIVEGKGVVLMKFDKAILTGANGGVGAVPASVIVGVMPEEITFS